MARDGLGWCAAGAAVGAVLVGALLPAMVDADPPSAARAGPGGTEPVAGGRTDTATLGGIDVAAADGGRADSPAPGASPVDGPSASGGHGSASGAAGGETIRLGFLLLDIAGLSSVAGEAAAGIDPAQQREAFEVYIADLNERGGIGGRRVQGEYRVFDLLSQDDQRAACLELTRDKKVFAVIAAGGFGGPPMLCITEENRTPLLNHGSLGTPSEYIERSGGRLFTLFQATRRQMTNWVDELERLGTLRGKKVGILSDEYSDPGDLGVGRALLPALEAAGIEVTYRARLSGDLEVGAGQIPVEAQRMRSAGVDIVLLPAYPLYAIQFVQFADSQGWVPGWLTSDFAAMYTDATASQMPASFRGATLVTAVRVGDWRLDRPEPPDDRACRELYERATGKSLPRSEGGTTSNAYGLTLSSCALMHSFEAGARAVGAGVTPESFVDALQRVGPVPIPLMGGGSYRPGKPDAADLLRTNRWHEDCTCWIPADDFHLSRH